MTSPWLVSSLLNVMMAGKMAELLSCSVYWDDGEVESQSGKVVTALFLNV